ncbi:MAG TPA: C69 family dipeptidase [Salinivirgaceae bacterium]|nr:C69 family dipeptidase [Salinivirgaceae bacterium]HQA76482.1 C69 family dipeptidase [Salinivirgaceae bacterium]
MRIKPIAILASVILVFSTTNTTDACTNYLVTKGASTDGSTMVTYSADSHQLYGEVYYWPAAKYKPGTMLKIYEWDSHKYLGEIAQALETYNVVGNMNEFQLVIGETTFTGREELIDTLGIMDYGSLIYVTLQRAKNAREAMKIMTELVAEYGYCSSGESFSIADPNEVWIMELIGKGVGNSGAVWVARMIPDGYVSGHANQARITTFPFAKENNWFDENQTTFNSPDVISFAREKGYYNGSDENFSFSDIYNPLDFGGVRFCELRVWTFFKDVNKDMWQHFDYVKGHIQKDEQGIGTNRMPLWIKPENKVSPQDLMHYMRDHLEGTELNMANDLGAGPYGKPYRWRPLTWTVDSVEYCNERTTATQQTGFSFVTQSRSWMPNKLGGIIWFGVDDAATSVYVPLYSSITKIPHAYQQGNGDMATFSETSAFWIFNLVSNWAYLRYNIVFPDIKKVVDEMEAKFKQQVEETDAKALEIYNKDPNKAVAYLTDFSVNAGQSLFNRWKELFKFLVVKYIDGNVKPEENGVFKTTLEGVIKVEQPGYPEWYLRMIVEQTKDQLLVIGQKNKPQTDAMITISKANLNIMIGIIVGLSVLLLFILIKRRR